MHVQNKTDFQKIFKQQLGQQETPQVQPCSCACQKRPDVILTKAHFAQTEHELELEQGLK